jgi:hypothetical protein
MITTEQLIREVRPNRTVLFFGAGSSIPSGIPGGDEMKARIAKAFQIESENFSLAEVALLAEIKNSRSSLIKELREIVGRRRPTGALLNLPLYRWKSLFTTNYDELIEQSYKRREKGLVVYHTNYDFSKDVGPNDQLLFKLHGTIGEDVCDGSNSRIIITQSDYDKTAEYRENIFSRFAAELAGADLIVVGQKLDDPDVRSVIDRALSIQAKLYGGAGTVTLLLYEKDPNRAAIFESRGVRVCFGGIDEFFAGLAALAAHDISDSQPAGDLLDQFPALRPATIDVRHSVSAFLPSVNAMFNGRPATYADIAAKLTFDRSISNNIVRLLTETEALCGGVIGASGVGKTTAARQVAIKLLALGWHCWEHKTDLPLSARDWIKMSSALGDAKQHGLLIVDEAHAHLDSLNEIMDRSGAIKFPGLRVLYLSARGNWLHRVKSPLIFKRGKEYQLSSLNMLEVDRLITLVETSDAIRPLVEKSFSGFSRQQKRSRLIDRCEQDMFVCLKNIFASEKFDDIILREFNELEKGLQDIYRIVAAMETAGVRVHRQLVIRLLNIPAEAISGVLSRLSDIIREYDILGEIGIFGWRVRHGVIADIITRYKFYHLSEFVALLDQVIDNLSPSYQIERRTITEMCNFETGLSRIPDRAIQNRLLRRLISIAPGERVPRHRLIRNLIEDDQFELAETEIRVFSRELGQDGPVARYKAVLLLARAIHTPGLSKDDRLVILTRARGSACASQDRYPNNRNLFGVACDIGLEIYKLSGDPQPFNEALEGLRKAETRLADPEITKMIRSFERKWGMANQRGVGSATSQGETDL